MDFLNIVNNNKFAVGLAMITMNIGSRYILTDVTAKQDALFKNPVFKKIALFCIFFVGTRDILVASMLWFAVTFILDYLMNENRKYNIMNYFFDMKPMHILYNKYSETHKKLSV